MERGRFVSAWRAYSWLIPAAIVLYATYMAWDATREYFNPDDITNMYRGQNRGYLDLILSQLSVWQNYDRLLGILYFKIVYDVFGFHVMPFRLGSLLICAINLVLLNAFLKRLIREDSIRWVALLAASFHGAMWSIYASAGTIFDVLCQTFALVALLYYAASRDRPVRLWRLAAIGLATNCAIAAKEVGFAVPLLLTAYESAIVPRQLAGYDWRDRWSAVPRLAVSYGVALVAGIGSLLFYDVMKMDAYAPTYSLERFLATTKAHAESVMFKTVALPGSTWAAVILALLLVAIAARSRNAIFGWLFYNIAVLPLAFSMPRTDGYVVYVAFLGWAIYLGGLLEFVYARQPGPSWRTAAAALAAGLLLWMQNEQREAVPGRFGPAGQNEVRALAQQIPAMHPRLPRHARILLINPSTGVDEWQPVMTLHLAYYDRSLEISRLALPEDATPTRDPAYDYVFLYKDGRYTEITSP